jgi:hypoxanthine phosphoribosyltransferase
VASSFTPDFYLPQQDLYIELTTLKQPLVTKKNRKLRRLKELYPEVNIKILYASDYQKLVQKFAASSSGGRQSSIEG